MLEPWLSADDIAAHLGVTKDTVYAWISDIARCLPTRWAGSGSSRLARSTPGFVPVARGPPPDRASGQSRAQMTSQAAADLRSEMLA